MSGLAAAQDSGPSLGEAAKQSASTGKSRVVITDETLDRSPATARHEDSVADATADKTSAESSADGTDADAPKSADPAESPEHVAARQTVERMQTVIDREEKAAKLSEEELANAQTPDERNRIQAALTSHRQHLQDLDGDLRDAQEELKRTPFSTKPAQAPIDAQ